MKYTSEFLAQMQELPLWRKVQISTARIIEWYQHYDGRVMISFSGGKDSTVLLHLVRQTFPNVKALFINTGLEYPEVQDFAKKSENVDVIRPKIPFPEVISRYGYPLISKEVSDSIYYSRRIQSPSERCKSVDMNRMEMTGQRERKEGGKSRFNKDKWLPLCQNTSFLIGNLCCYWMKKSPSKAYQHANKLMPILGTLAEESLMRKQAWLKRGCNAFEGRKASSQPISFWTEQDVLNYIRLNHLEIASVYGDIITTGPDGQTVTPAGNLGYFKQDGEWVDGMEGCTHSCSGCNRTGCIFCGFGAHLDKGETRFQRLAKTHPRQYEYCMSGGQWVDNPAYDPTASKMDDFWENWNPKKIWVPSKEGLGMKHVFDECNAIYGKDFIRYD